MSSLKIRYSRYGIEFEWFGGEYIDIKFIDKPYAFECINTWDYALNQSTIPFDKRALRKEAQEWIDENLENLDEYRMTQ